MSESPVTLQDQLREGLRRLKAKKGWTQHALAERLGTTQQTISSYLNGRGPSEELQEGVFRLLVASGHARPILTDKGKR